MIRNLFFSALLCFSVAGSLAQSSFPQGGYKNIDELKKKQPSLNIECRPIERTKEEILYSGGNNYFMRCRGEGVDPKIVTSEIFAISTGNKLFLNTSVHQLAIGYANTLSEGRYLTFFSGFKEKKKKRIMAEALSAGNEEYDLSIPPATRAVLANAKPPKRYLLVIDIQTGIVSLCDRNFLIQILRPYPDIEYQYALEPEQNSDQTLINYVQMVNRVSGK